MGGSNPYLPKQKIDLPKQKYTLEFRPHNKSIQVDPAALPYDRTGLKGSLLEIAMGHGIDIDHACGGVAACSTCHVWVKKGLQSCNEPLDEELDQLDNAPGANLESRLACQCVPNGSEAVVVEIPAWNRNLAREHHD